jgi:penicillin amidase
MRKALLAVVAILLIASIGLSCVEPEPEPEPEVRCTIIRDDYGVPHVFADTKADLTYGAGYAMAQDRLWQADVMRRAASGRLAEFDLASVGEDLATRTLWYGQTELQQMYDDWNPGTGYEHLKPMIEAYVDGINQYIYEANLDPYLVPVEYVPLGGTGAIEDFTVADVVGVTVLMGWRFGGTGGSEADIYEALLTLQAMHADNATGSAIWSDLFPLDDAGAPVTIPATGCETLAALSTDVSSPDVPDNLSGVLEGAQELWATQDEVFTRLGIPTKFGSNAVPVSSNLSDTGYALELGGPQMGYTIPQIVYDLGLHGAGINAQGMAMPAAGPFILIGVSEYGAWTSTTGASDVMDIRILGLNPSNPFQYWYNGEWKDMEERTEIIYDATGTAHNETCYRSVYGPVVDIDPMAHQGVTMHVPFFKNEIAGEQGWQLFQEATNIEEFEDACELLWPNHNFYWADTAGNIGYWHAGRFPVKPVSADRRLPLMGDGTQEWVRVTDPEEMPRCINPDQGWLANWNNKPIADWEYAESDIHWGEGHRVQILMDAMATFAAAGDLTTDTLNQVSQIGGYHSTGGMSFAGNVTAVALASTNVTLNTAGSHLAAWAGATPPISRVDLVSPMWPDNEDPTYDHPGLTIFNAWYDRIFSKVFAGILPPDLISQVEHYPSLLIRVFRSDPSLLYPGYPSGATLTTMIEDALEEAVDYLTADYGSSDMSTWLTPVRMQGYDEQGALPAAAFEHPYMNRGTYGQIAEMVPGGVPNAMDVIPPGQSGFMYLDIAGGKVPTPTPSPYAYDQVELYASWTYKTMLFTQAAVEDVETSRTVFYVE